MFNQFQFNQARFNQSTGAGGATVFHSWLQVARAVGGFIVGQRKDWSMTAKRQTGGFMTTFGRKAK